MVVKRFMCPYEWEDTSDIKNQNTDIWVQLEDGYLYIVTVGTIQNIEYLMDKNQKNYSEPGIPFIIVKEFTKEIIKETIKAYAEKDNGYWLKFYHFVGEIDETVFEELEAKRVQESSDD